VNELIRRAYRRYRKEHPYVAAQHALGVAKRAHTLPTWAENFTDHHDTWTGTVDGWDITITSEPDDMADFSKLGTFTDDNSDPLTVTNPEWNGDSRNYQFFRPEWIHYWRQGTSKQDARRRLIESVRQDAQMACEQQYVITATASREGVELGTEHLGGTYLDSSNDLMWAVEDHDMIGEAIARAEEALPKHIQSLRDKADALEQ
jgi:hypothetical protein